MSKLETSIRKVFNEIWKQEKGTDAPELLPDTILLESGLDSLGFAIFVSMLDEELGFDPFTISVESYYPQKFAEFVAFYEKYQPKE